MKECRNCQHDKIRDKLQNSADYTEKVQEISRVFSLLGDLSRMKILLALMEGELCVYHICEITGAKQSATSQHLKKLKDAKILKCRKEANQIIYSISDEHIKNIINNVIMHRDC